MSVCVSAFSQCRHCILQRAYLLVVCINASIHVIRHLQARGLRTCPCAHHLPAPEAADHRVLFGRCAQSCPAADDNSWRCSLRRLLRRLGRGIFCVLIFRQPQASPLGLLPVYLLRSAMCVRVRDDEMQGQET